MAIIIAIAASAVFSAGIVTGLVIAERIAAKRQPQPSQSTKALLSGWQYSKWAMGGDDFTAND